MSLDRHEQMYAADEDPWGTRTSWYERRKFAMTVAALRQPRYGRVLELACGTGELNRLLAPRCDELLAVDGSPTAVRLAREAAEANVTVRQAVLPGEYPPGTFDLVVCSEIAYYLPKNERDELADRTAAALPAGGELLAVTWRGEAEDIAAPADVVHAELRAHPEFEPVGGYQDDGFRLDVLTRR